MRWFAPFILVLSIAAFFWGRPGTPAPKAALGSSESAATRSFGDAVSARELSGMSEGECDESFEPVGSIETRAVLMRWRGAWRDGLAAASIDENQNLFKPGFSLMETFMETRVLVADDELSPAADGLRFVGLQGMGPEGHMRLGSSHGDGFRELEVRRLSGDADTCARLEVKEAFDNHGHALLLVKGLGTATGDNSIRQFIR